MTTRVIALCPDGSNANVELVVQELHKGGHAQIDPDFWQTVSRHPITAGQFPTGIYIHSTQRIVIEESPKVTA